MSSAMESTAVWHDTVATPEAVQVTLDARAGLDAALSVMRQAPLLRLVAVGNGASAYVGQALALAALAGRHRPVEVLAVPAGLLATGDFRWHEGDALLAISASGELRDLIEAMECLPARIPCIAITGDPASSVASRSDAVAVVASPPQTAVTHTHAFCGALATCLALWAEFSGDDVLRGEVADVPGAMRVGIRDAVSWAREVLPEIQQPDAVFAYGSGATWAAAMETALLVKEIAQVPSEGVETREAATTAMTTLLPGHLVVNLTPDDPYAKESEEIARRRGATILRAPGVARDRRLSALTTFPSAVALATVLACRVGRDPDKPTWTNLYYETARKRGTDTV